MHRTPIRPEERPSGFRKVDSRVAGNPEVDGIASIAPEKNRLCRTADQKVAGWVKNDRMRTPIVQYSVYL